MSKAYIGIDPGSKGFIAIDSGGELEFYPLAGLDIGALSDLFYDIAARHPLRAAAIEDVRAIHGSSSTSTFAFGLNKGVLLALLAATATPYEQVLPQRWQKAMWSPSDIVRSGQKTDTKRTSMNAARRLAPHVDFRRSDKCKAIDDNKCDSFLLSQYAKRISL